MNNKECCKHLNKILTKILATPYNWGLIIISGLIFLLFTMPYSTNYGYDRLTSWFDMVILFSGACLIAKYVQEYNKQDMVAEYSVCSFLFSLMTLLLAKTLYLGVFITNIVMFILTPISIFLFLILIKHIYLSTKSATK